MRKANGRKIGRKAFNNLDIAALHLPSVAQRYRLPNAALRVAERIVPGQVTAEELRKGEARYQRAFARSEAAREERNQLVRAAIEAGWTHAPDR